MAWSEKRGSGKQTWYVGRYKTPSGSSETVRDGGGRPLRFTAKTKAVNAAEAEEVKIRDGAWIDPRVGRITFAEYVEGVWLPNKVGEKRTVGNYRQLYYYALKPVFGHMRLNAILHSHVQGWVSGMVEAGVTPGTIGTRFRALQTILGGPRAKGSSAMRDRLIQVNPCEGVALPYAPPREVTIYTPAEVSALIEHVDGWFQLVGILGFQTGARWGELMGLQTDDFTLDYRSVNVRRTILTLKKSDTGNGTRFLTKPYPKGRDQREIKLLKPVRKAVAAHVEARQLGRGDRLFSMPTPGPEGQWVPRRTEAWPHGLPIDGNWFRSHVWYPAIDAAGLERRRIHDLRASYISWMLAGGTDLPTAMLSAGHKHLATTERYVTAMDAAADRAADGLAAALKRFGEGTSASVTPLNGR